MFKFIASAAIAASALFAPSAEAYTHGQQQLLNALDTAGVTVESGECESTDSYGFFAPAYNYIGICTNVATTYEQQWETLRHEAVHAAQRCVNPGMDELVTSRRYLELNSDPNELHWITLNYPKSHWYAEFEAFTLMRYSNQTIAEVVNRACNWGHHPANAGFIF